ncbi:toxin-activating lysine-acyltransferase [Massilia sp. CF038]|uniref:toxin-activating lysine-acyltransferase n=1 Tax=Massilia sp. CF038 TaxID=1881045 RepID=UPI000910C5CD|nr:toxin-activating lysine-acyltransferase [Massilia sp. CF038]SHH62973.1 cytolysin-activating lysine-acyltransferase [Massilia sp. CF038]
MQATPFNITAPALGMPGRSEPEVMGAVTWLWMHSPVHRELPLIALSQTLLAPMKAQQYILASQADGEGGFRPVAYLAWANLSAEAEARYVQGGASALLRDADWTSGDRMWITDWVTPFGHANEFRHLVSTLLAQSCFRALYHRAGSGPQRVKAMRGANVSRAEADAWWSARPLPAHASAI